MELISNFNQLERYFLIFILSINITSFFIFGLDKVKAKSKSWRIPELQLIILSLIGGGIGSIIGMVMFKHKLSKKLFSWGIPIIILLNILLFIFIFNKIR